MTAIWFRKQFRGLGSQRRPQALSLRSEEQVLLEKIEPYTHSVGHNERTGTVIEPLLVRAVVCPHAGTRSARNSPPYAKAVSSFIPSIGRRPISIGSRMFATGASRAKSGGDIAFRSGRVKETGEIICSLDDPT
jgi:hypothetical protein